MLRNLKDQERAKCFISGERIEEKPLKMRSSQGCKGYYQSRVQDHGMEEGNPWAVQKPVSIRGQDR